MTRAAAMAAELAARATRLGNNRTAFRQEPDTVADRLLRLIDKIGKLDDTAAGDAKQAALSDAWAAYHKVQALLAQSYCADVKTASMVDFVGDDSDVVAIADFDGYEQSRINNGMRIADQAYEGWYGDHADWN